LLAREYRQHRGLDPYDLPDRYNEWVTKQTRAVAELAATGRRVVKMVIHPRELEFWAKATGLPVNGSTREAFANKLWQRDDAKEKGRAAFPNR